MKKRLISSLLCISSLYTSSAQAENNWYAGASYGGQEISLPGRDFNTAGLIAGYEINHFIALETRISVGTSGYSSVYSGTKDKYSEDIDSQGMFLLKASYPLLETLSIYGLVGYTSTKLEIEGFGAYNDINDNIVGSFQFTHTETFNGASYGVGLDYQVSDSISIFFEHQVLPDFDPFSVSESWKASTIGFTYAF